MLRKKNNFMHILLGLIQNMLNQSNFKIIFPQTRRWHFRQTFVVLFLDSFFTVFYSVLLSSYVFLMQIPYFKNQILPKVNNLHAIHSAASEESLGSTSTQNNVSLDFQFRQLNDLSQRNPIYYKIMMWPSVKLHFSSVMVNICAIVNTQKW